jgi:hypothetical protein
MKSEGDKRIALPALESLLHRRGLAFVHNAGRLGRRL